MEIEFETDQRATIALSVRDDDGEARIALVIEDGVDTVDLVLTQAESKQIRDALLKLRRHAQVTREGA